MSFESRIVSIDDNKKNENTVGLYHRHDHYLSSSVTYTSSLVVHLRQFQTDLRTQHQQEKHELIELNERFRRFVDRVQQLEAQNAKYVAHLAHFRGQSSGFSSVDIEWKENYLHFRADATTASYGKVNFELELEMFQLQIATYQQLIDSEQQWKSERRLKLEQELHQLSSTVSTLSVSYAGMGRDVELLYAARSDTWQQYLKFTSEWCRAKKTTKEWELSLQTLKHHIGFYKNIDSYSSWGSKSVSIESFDVKQFWTLELDQSIKKIRHDFELLYATIAQQTSLHYSAKMKEVGLEVQQGFQYQKIEFEELATSQQTLQIEYESVQKSYSYEHEIYLKLEASFAKFESEYESIQFQHDEQIDIQSKTVQSLQESIMTMGYDIEQIRQRKIILESEIIVYRHLLGNVEMTEQTVILPPPAPVSSTTKRQLVVKSRKKGAVGIKECPPDGTYISLMNQSTSEEVDISKWVLKRRIDSKTELRYTLPVQTRLQPGAQLRIYSKLEATAAKALIKRAVSLSLRQELINNDINSWGTGNTIETTLLNPNGEEKATHSQSISLEETL